MYPMDVIFPESKAGGFPAIDSTVLFYTRISALVLPEHTVLDMGAGRGQWLIEDKFPFRRGLRTLRGKCREVIGCDFDPVVMTNPGLDRAFILSADGKLDLPDTSIDLVFCDWVFEHVEDPTKFVAEVNRVLKPGGWICARTPNRFGYISLSARIIPKRWHQFVLSIAQPNRKSEDVFPAFYRLNSIGQLKKTFSPAAWVHCSHAWEPTPAYFGNSVLGWRFSMALTKFLPRSLGNILLVYIQKRP